jgi:hypothetical protein
MGKFWGVAMFMREIFAVSGLLLLAESSGAAVSLLTGWLPLLADATSLPDAMPFKFDLNNMTPVGVLAWYAWHNSARVLPRLIHDNQEQVTALTKQYMAHVTELIAKSGGELAAARMQFDQMLQAERKYSQEQTELLRDRVHDMANTANAGLLQVVSAVEHLAKLAGVVESKSSGSRA